MSTTLLNEYGMVWQLNVPVAHDSGDW